MPAYQFLSDEWIAAARMIQDDQDGVDDVALLRMNLVVNEMPFGSDTLDAHIDTTSGRLEIDLGHLETVDVTVQLTYKLARSILIDGDGQAAIGGFFTRKLRVDGDMSKLLAFQAASPGPRQEVVAQRLREMTAP